MGFTYGSPYTLKHYIWVVIMVEVSKTLKHIQLIICEILELIKVFKDGEDFGGLAWFVRV